MERITEWEHLPEEFDVFCIGDWDITKMKTDEDDEFVGIQGNLYVKGNLNAVRIAIIGNACIIGDAQYLELNCDGEVYVGGNVEGLDECGWTYSDGDFLCKGFFKAEEFNGKADFIVGKYAHVFGDVRCHNASIEEDFIVGQCLTSCHISTGGALGVEEGMKCLTATANPKKGIYIGVPLAWCNSF